MKKFTLIELLVVVAIIGILASMLLPALGKAREQSKSTVCLNKLKQISIAAFMYAEGEDNYAPINEESHPWSKKLSENDFLPELNTSDNNGIYSCPNGAEITNYWAINYAMNWRLGWDNGSDTQEGYHANLSLDSTHASSIIFFLDAYNNNAILWKNSLSENGIFNIDKTLRVARHQNKGNVIFVDGHAENTSGQQLLYMGSVPYEEDLWTP
ncbi:prepilin-type N-terminal cleavage/methylation domain-containing protein [Lentisphaera profundi]|uniref:Prepilin-type N-terminal cleavage/methylation domain-containing protein n=1 Tax=Lentisphaera profundi TaxID=1658616 RepID=A0ABY7VQN7_9BACT|nr:prepilin-type N-terminal cleavage/methylation domain-containing protein [Lentisphaera profundi]WDE96515.1 prepilin-type N-terminal cleavage/methylation domain-containing protein [Lentisphaera profundi]